MAYWPEIVRNKPFLSLLALAAAAIVVWAAWFVGTLWGPAVWVPLVGVALTSIAFVAWYQAMREARLRATADPFSFGEVVVRMHARERAQALITAERRERHVAALRSRSTPQRDERLDGVVSPTLADLFDSGTSWVGS